MPREAGRGFPEQTSLKSPLSLKMEVFLSVYMQLPECVKAAPAPDPDTTQQHLLGATPELINAASQGNLFSMTINGDKWSLSLHKNNGLILYPRRFLLGPSKTFQQLIVVKQRNTLHSEGVPSLSLEN